MRYATEFQRSVRGVAVRYPDWVRTFATLVLITIYADLAVPEWKVSRSSACDPESRNTTVQSVDKVTTLRRRVGGQPSLPPLVVVAKTLEPWASRHGDQPWRR